MDPAKLWIEAKLVEDMAASRSSAAEYAAKHWVLPGMVPQLQVPGAEADFCEAWVRRRPDRDRPGQRTLAHHRGLGVSDLRACLSTNAPGTCLPHSP